jgi:hypothetical protein
VFQVMDYFLPMRCLYLSEFSMMVGLYFIEIFNGQKRGLWKMHSYFFLHKHYPLGKMHGS